MADFTRRYSISEVSELVNEPVHILRQWEARVPQLKPRRDRANRRYYTAKDIEIVRRLKDLIRHNKLTTKGAARQLAQELHGEGAPRTNQEMLDLLDQMEDHVRAMRAILHDDEPTP